MTDKPSIRPHLVRLMFMLASMGLVSLALWTVVDRQRQAHIRHVMSILVRGAQLDLHDGIGTQAKGLLKLAENWKIANASTRTKVESDSRLFRSHHPWFTSLRWLDPEGNLIWRLEADQHLAVQSVANAYLEEAISYLEAHPESKSFFTPVFKSSSGTHYRDLIIVASEHRLTKGYLVVTVDEARLLAAVLSDHADAGYAISIIEDGEEFYRIPDKDISPGEWMQESALHVDGANWFLRVSPTEDLLAEFESLSRRTSMALGLIVGFLLFLSLDFARTAYLRSEQIKEMHAVLEARVRERTADLSLANERLEREMHERLEAEHSLRELSGHLLRLKDEEQRRIGRELHDSTAQLLAAISINIERLAQAPLGVREKMILSESTNLLETVTNEVRTISYLLHPPFLDQLGLQEVLSWYVTGFTQRSGTKVDLTIQPGLERLPSEIELAIYRIVQEGLSNVWRHSGSSSANVNLFRQDGEVILEVRDTGNGIRADIYERINNNRVVIGVGIAGMTERVRQLGGLLAMNSNDQGTVVRVMLPISPDSHRLQNDQRRKSTSVKVC